MTVPASSLNDNQKKVLQALLDIYYETGNKSVGPTAIGTRLGYNYNTASSRTSPVLNRLVDLGYAYRDTAKKGRYFPA